MALALGDRVPSSGYARGVPKGAVMMACACDAAVFVVPEAWLGQGKGPSCGRESCPGEDVLALADRAEVIEACDGFAWGDETHDEVWGDDTVDPSAPRCPADGSAERVYPVYRLGAA